MERSRRVPAAEQRVRAGALAGLAIGVAACSVVPVASDLDDGEANRIVVQLDRSGIDSRKEPEPDKDGRFRVGVTEGEFARALGILHDAELPRPRRSASTASGLLRSLAEERAELLAARAADLERTLTSIDGVLTARVHLGDGDDPFHEGKAPRATASVLLSHREASPPIAVSAVQRLVAGAVSGLATADVAVVTVARGPSIAGRAPLARLGPIAVAPSSLGALRAILVALLSVIAALALATIVLYRAVRRARIPSRT